MYEESPEGINDSRYHPSFVGKTWGTMKQMENNRHFNSLNYFTDKDELNEELQILYKNFESGIYLNSFATSYEECITLWRQNPSQILNLNGISGTSFCDPDAAIKNYLEKLPDDVHSFMLTPWGRPVQIPFSLTQRKNLVALKIRAYQLPVMPYVKILHLSHINLNFDKSPIDLSGWASLQILKINTNNGTSLPHIYLPPNLKSLHLDMCVSEKITKFEDHFQNTTENISIFQSLRNVDLTGVKWSTLPILTECRYFSIAACGNLQYVEAPKCKSLTAIQCKSFLGFGPDSLLHNKSLEHVDLMSAPGLHHFPPGSSSGYRHISIWGTKISSLPTKFGPHAYVSILSRIKSFNPYLYINNKQVLDNMIFYYNSDLSRDKMEIPEKGETVEKMMNRLYGFNWPKFSTKIQRQYRFNKYIKNMYPTLSTFINHDICLYEIAQLFGAQQNYSCKKSKNLISKKCMKKKSTINFK